MYRVLGTESIVQNWHLVHVRTHQNSFAFLYKMKTGNEKKNRLKKLIPFEIFFKGIYFRFEDKIQILWEKMLFKSYNSENV